MRIVLRLSILLVLAAPAHAQVERVTDGGFDDPATPAWEFNNYDMSTLLWDTADASGSASSGSLLFQKKVGSNPNTLRATQCIEVAPGETFTLGGKLYWPLASDAADGTPFLRVGWLLASTCTGIAGSPDAGFVSIDAPPRDVWTPVSGLVTAPAGVHSGLIYVGVIANVDLGSPTIFEARWDDLSFVPEPDAALGSLAAFGALGVARGWRASRTRATI